MAGRTKGAGPTSIRVAENLRRIRQERGFSYAELSRRLTMVGHPILDTGLLKIEKGERRVDVDDLIALAIALETTPNRLLLPVVDVNHLTDYYLLTPQVKDTPPLLWEWATGEVPLGHLPASPRNDRTTRGEEVIFSRENRQQHWNAPGQTVPQPGEGSAARVFAVTGLTAFVQQAFFAGFTTADIRAAVEGALVTALVNPDPASASVRIEVTEGQVIIGEPDPTDVQEAR